MSETAKTADESEGTKDRFEAEATKFGNGAHVTVPKEWMGSIVRVERVGSWYPPLFEDVAEGAKVFVETKDGEEFSGEVFEFDMTVKPKKMYSRILVDTGHDLYRIETSRNVGEDGWSGTYTLERGVGGDEIQESDEVLELDSSVEGGAIWEPEGEVDGLAVLKPA